MLGSFDTARVQRLIDRVVPVFEEEGTAPKPGLTAAELVTNEFLDKSISLNWLAGRVPAEWRAVRYPALRIAPDIALDHLSTVIDVGAAPSVDLEVRAAH